MSEQERDELQAQVDVLKNSGATSKQHPKPTITDVSLQLPRTAGSLKERSADQIKYIVLNHTAVDPSVKVERIATAHQQRWGGILYQYLIAGDGNILQPNALDQVVDLSQPWISQGINVAVAGNFTSETPSPAQIKAAAELIVWLLQEYGIAVADVKGVSEFIVTQSPGAQWLTGKKWKETLLAAVAAEQAAAPQTPTAPTTGVGAATVAALRAQVTQLQTTLNQALAKNTTLQQERDRLAAQVKEPAANEAKLIQQVQTLTQQVTTLTGEKTTLSQQVQTVNQQVQALTGEKTKLNQQLQTLNQQVSSASQEKQTLTKKISDLETRIAQLQSGIGATAPVTTGPSQAPTPQIIDIVDKLAKHATAKYDTRTLDKITHIAIHHTAGPGNVPPENIAAYHVRNGWPGMGYHFYVTPEGTIYQTNKLETVSYQVYKQNSYSLGITIAGNFINGAIPTPKQIESVGTLAAWLMQKLNIPLKNVMGHKEYPENATTCPGSDWLTGQKWKTQILDRIQAVQSGKTAPAAKAIGHYMLFWQRADTWAKEDWSAAANYFARFRPTTGFSAEDAKNAEYVTIVGGVAGVPYETEQMLTAAGCKVERLSGVDYNDTKRMLDELASSGKRFRTFNV